MTNYILESALAPHQYCNVRYPTGFKLAITLGSVCKYKGPIPIDLFCSLIFMQSVTEILLNKVCPLFPARFAPMILAYRVPLNVWEGGYYIIGANRAGKSARSLFNCITVMDCIKINEQNKSIGIGPLYTYKPNLKQLDYFYLSYGGFEPGQVSNVAILAWSKKTIACNLS